MEYLDFEVEIESRIGSEYQIEVVDSPAGEAREAIVFPFDKLELENRLQALQIALLRSGGKRRKVLTAEEEAVREFGKSLFDALLSGEVRSRYDISLREAARSGKGLRIKLRIESPEMAALPWEFLFDPRQDEFVCLSRNNPVVRYLEVPQPIRPLMVDLPLQILAMVAAPQDLSALNVAREKARVEKAVERLVERGLVELTWLEGQTWRHLQRALQRGPWHIFHFIGHGGFDARTDEGLIVLADERGQTHLMTATQLGRLLADHASLRLVLLNTCEGARGSESDIFSSSASILVRRGLPAVIAMQYEITDPAAIEFSHSFYEALANGMPVDTAVAEARKAISLAVTNTFEWGTPVLYLRAPDGKIFEFPQEVAQRIVPPAPEIAPDPQAEARVEALYTQGLNAFYLEDFEAANRAFRQVLAEQPDHDNAAAKLEESTQKMRRAELYNQATLAEESGEWKSAVEALEALQEGEPDNREVEAKLARARKMAQAAALYEEARQLFEAEAWQAVVNVFEQAREIDPDFPDPDGLLPVARERAAHQARQAELEALYAQALRKMDAQEWEAALQLLSQVRDLEPGYEGSDRLIERVEGEIRRQQEDQQRRRQVEALYLAAQRAAGDGEWKKALSRLEEIQSLDPAFEDPEGVGPRARAALQEEQAEREKYETLAALYAEAVELLKQKQYQGALEKWGEVTDLDPQYPDRENVERTARKKLKDLAAEPQPARRLPRWAWVLIGAVVVVGAAALLLWWFLPRGTIAFVSERDGNSEIYLMGSGGSEQRNLSKNSAEDLMPAVSPNGDYIIFTSDRVGGFQIYRLDQNGRSFLPLTGNPFDGSDPAWSRDGKKIAFVSERRGNSDIYVMNADGSQQLNLSDHEADDTGPPSWSPDGEQILFVSNRDGNKNIYVMNADGSAQRQLTFNTGDDQYPSWSPDGREIVYSSHRDGSRDIFILNLDGSTLMNLTDDPQPDYRPAWSPNGRYIAFASNRGGNMDIYRISAGGGGLTRLTDDPAQDRDPSWGP